MFSVYRKKKKREREGERKKWEEKNVKEQARIGDRINSAFASVSSASACWVAFPSSSEGSSAYPSYHCS